MKNTIQTQSAPWFESPRFQAGILILLGLIFWFPVTKFDFLSYDDLVYFEYPEVAAFRLSLLPEFFSKAHVGIYIPLTVLSFAIENALFGQNPFYFHLNNILLHLANTLLVWNIFRKHFNWQSPIPFLLCLIFLIHPLQVESVSWISCRGNLLSSFFFLLSLSFYFDWREKEKQSKYLGAITFFLLAALSKPGAVVLPVIFVLVDWKLGRSLFSMFQTRYWLPLLPAFLVSLAVGIITLKFTESSLVYSADFDLLDQLVLIFHSISHYFYYFFAPVNLNPAYFFPASESQIPWFYYLGLPFLLSLLYGIYKLPPAQRKTTLFAFGFLLINLLLVLQIIPRRPTLAADRYAYLPMVGILIMVGAIIQYLIKNKAQWKAPVLWILLFSTLPFGYISFNYQKLWAKTDVLMLYSLRSYPEHPMRKFQFVTLGVEALRNQDFNEAINWFELAAELDEDWPYLYSNYGIALARNGNFSKAIEIFESKIVDDKRGFGLLANLGGAYTATGQHQKAIEVCNKALEMNPLSTIALANRGIAKARLGLHSEALDDYQRTLSLKRDQPDVFYFRGYSYLALGEKQKACADWEQALRLGNNSAQNPLQLNCK